MVLQCQKLEMEVQLYKVSAWKLLDSNRVLQEHGQGVWIHELAFHIGIWQG